MLKDGERAALEFSGGRDSRAVLELARPLKDRITVYFADTGAVFPHVREYIFQTCRDLGFRLEVVTPPRPVQDHIDAEGLPSDIVPVEATLEMLQHVAERPRDLVQSYMRCCRVNIFEPLERALREAKEHIVFRGAKKSDSRVGMGPHFIAGGIEYRHPIWDWDAHRVATFLADHQVQLPQQYNDGIGDSLDCWICTAHSNHQGLAKSRWMRRHTPELYAEVRERRKRLESIVMRSQRALREIAFEESFK